MVDHKEKNQLVALRIEYFEYKAYNNGGANRGRTGDLMHAMHALYQLSYSPLRSVLYRNIVNLFIKSFN